MFFNHALYQSNVNYDVWFIAFNLCDLCFSLEAEWSAGMRMFMLSMISWSIPLELKYGKALNAISVQISKIAEQRWEKRQMLQKTNKENRSIFIGFTKSVEGYGKGTEFHDILWFV